MKNLIIFIYHLITSCFLLNAQSILNPNSSKNLMNEWLTFNYPTNEFNTNNKLNIIYNNNSYYNSNIPNVENRNGIYLPKGYGSISSALVSFNTKSLFISTEPQITLIKEFSIQLPKKEKEFSNLNDVPLLKEYTNSITNFRNTGFKYKSNKISIGYGNWDQWWGPGVHNSLVLSNNARSFNYYLLSTDGYKKLTNNLLYELKYIVSENMINIYQNNFYLTSYFIKVKYKNIELGKSKNIINGGYEDINWTFKDAYKLLITNEKIEYWNKLVSYYLKVTVPNSKLIMFFEFGFPDKNIKNQTLLETYPDHSIGTNFGMRKYGLFNINQLMVGFEYTSTLTSQYYHKLPTQNWYSNPRNDFMSNNGRRWAAHSGTDSDDFILMLGYFNKNFSLVYENNFERHGVTYKYPPEVKLESRILVTYKMKNIFLNLFYENENFEHYGFVDDAKNVRNEDNNYGSIQNTNTLLLTLEYRILY